jgi:N-acyl-D-amino-acid deacylase
MKRILLTAAVAALCFGCAPKAETLHDIVIRNGTIVDGSGGKPYTGDVAIDGDKITAVGKVEGKGKQEIDATGKAVSPGFVNMLSHVMTALMVDGRALGDITQGVTMEVMGEGSSLGPLTDLMKKQTVEREGDIKYDVTWTSLDEALSQLEKKGIAPNIGSMVGAHTVRIHVLGEDDVDPTPEQLGEMRKLVDTAMEEGALGVGSSLIYAPGTYAETPELVALATEAGRCGGMYLSHIRYETDRLFEAMDELIEISRQSGAPAEFWHMKQAGKANWDKYDGAVERIEKARKEGLKISANMYTYTAGSTGLDAAMPTWVQAGGREKWIERLKDKKTRAKVIAEMRDPKATWENLYRHAGAEGTLLVGFRNDALKPLTGKTLAEVAKERGVSPEDAAIDLVIEDGSRVQVVYFLMNEENVKKQIALPWMSFGSDAAGMAPEGVFLKSSTHPRAYGNVTRLLGKYVRDEKVIPLEEAVRKLTSLPSTNLGLHGRGLLKAGYFADVVVFNPATISDHATYEKPHQLSTGVLDVIVNGGLALKDGQPTGAPTGKVVRGRGWKGWPDGGCKANAKDWVPLAQ